MTRLTLLLILTLVLSGCAHGQGGILAQVLDAGGRRCVDQSRIAQVRVVKNSSKDYISGA